MWKFNTNEVKQVIKKNKGQENKTTCSTCKTWNENKWIMKYIKIKRK